MKALVLNHTKMILSISNYNRPDEPLRFYVSRQGKNERKKPLVEKF